MNIVSKKYKKFEIIENERYVNMIIDLGEMDNYGIPLMEMKTYYYDEYAWKNKKRFLKFLKMKLLKEFEYEK